MHAWGPNSARARAWTRGHRAAKLQAACQLAHVGGIRSDSANGHASIRPGPPACGPAPRPVRAAPGSLRHPRARAACTLWCAPSRRRSHAALWLPRRQGTSAAGGARGLGVHARALNGPPPPGVAAGACHAATRATGLGARKPGRRPWPHAGDPVSEPWDGRRPRPSQRGRGGFAAARTCARPPAVACRLLTAPAAAPGDSEVRRPQPPPAPAAPWTWRPGGGSAVAVAKPASPVRRTTTPFRAPPPVLHRVVCWACFAPPTSPTRVTEPSARKSVGQRAAPSVGAVVTDASPWRTPAEGTRRACRTATAPRAPAPISPPPVAAAAPVPGRVCHCRRSLFSFSLVVVSFFVRPPCRLHRAGIGARRRRRGRSTQQHDSPSPPRVARAGPPWRACRHRPSPRAPLAADRYAALPVARFHGARTPWPPSARGVLTSPMTTTYACIVYPADGAGTSRARRTHVPCAHTTEATRPHCTSDAKWARPPPPHRRRGGGRPDHATLAAAANADLDAAALC